MGFLKIIHHQSSKLGRLCDHTLLSYHSYLFVSVIYQLLGSTYYMPSIVPGVMWDVKT